MINSFNARIKPPMIAGFHAHFVYSLIFGLINFWLGILLLKEGQPIGLFMFLLALGVFSYGIYVLRNTSDWLMLDSFRSSKYESEARINLIEN